MMTSFDALLMIRQWMIGLMDRVVRGDDRRTGGIGLSFPPGTPYTRLIPRVGIFVLTHPEAVQRVPNGVHRCADRIVRVWCAGTLMFEIGYVVSRPHPTRGAGISG
jgi:hypothetical protein